MHLQIGLISISIRIMESYVQHVASMTTLYISTQLLLHQSQQYTDFSHGFLTATDEPTLAWIQENLSPVVTALRNCTQLDHHHNALACQCWLSFIQQRYNLMLRKNITQVGPSALGDINFCLDVHLRRQHTTLELIAVGSCRPGTCPLSFFCLLSYIWQET